MILVYTSILILKVWRIVVDAHKIDRSFFKTFGIIIASFQILVKLNRVWFFQKTFLLTDISIKVILKMLYLIFSNRNFQFADQEFA